MANTKPIGVAYEDQNIIGADIVKAANIATTGTIGYAAGAYDTVTQTNNKTTAVTINTPSGQIITANAQMAPSANAVFVVNCSTVSTRDVVVISIQASAPTQVSVSGVEMWGIKNGYAKENGRVNPK